MKKPIILTVDDDPQVLNAIERDLRKHYRNDYRVIKASSGSEALEVVYKLKQREDPVALFLVDQRMPYMSGTEFLSEAMKIYPDTRKVLLTAYADTQAAIDSINEIDLDYYLLKPWDPPEEQLFPVLDDLLSDWHQTFTPPYDGIRVAGTLWSPKSHDVKDFLARNRIPYKWLDIEQDKQASALVDATLDYEDQSHKKPRRLPVIFFPDGDVLIEPDFRTLAEKVGMQTQATQPFYDLIIIGAGPAGLGAAVYGASEGLRTLMIDKEATGGQAGTSSRIENYLGFPKGLSGVELAQRATTQAIRLGAEILTTQEATCVRVQDPYRYVILNDQTELSCRALIIATGVSVRRLDVPGIDRLTGAGVYYGAALTEAAYYRNRPIFVVGGANSAGQAAMFFTRYGSQVTMIIRGDRLQTSMSHYLIDQILNNPKIDIWTHSEVREVHGKDHLESISVINRKNGQKEEHSAAALFIFIGAQPHSELVSGLVACDPKGFIYTGTDLIREGKRPRGWQLPRDPYPLETSVPGIFAAGDIRFGAVRRVASAVGEGAIAVSQVHEYLKTV